MSVRINKYLADKGIATRRAADELIKAGKVKINNRVAALGDKVAENDKVEVENATLHALHSTFEYYAYHKPVGVVTHSAQEGEQEILDTLDLSHVAPIGRLDKESRGSILLTNDGRVTKRLLEPQFDHEKEYVVRVDKPLKQSTATKLAKGIKLEDGYITKPAKVFLEGDYTFRIILTEGKKHQIRRMAAALGYGVTDLRRVRIMNIELGDLAAGSFRPIEGTERAAFLKALHL